MQITEQWVGKAAGGRVLKAARAMVRLGKVTKVTRKDSSEGAVFQGAVGSGNRPMRVVVKVMGPTQVKNLCGCTMARSTGAMCEHAAALLIASIRMEESSEEGGVGSARNQGSAISDSASVAEVDVVPLAVRLSPHFPHQGMSAVHLRRVAASESTGGEAVGFGDRQLSSWLVENTGRADAAMLSLPEDKLAGFYRAIRHHARVTRGEQEVLVRAGALRPALELELEAEAGVMWLKFGQNEGMQGEMVLLGDQVAEWNDESGQLTVAERSSEVSLLADVIQVSDLIGGDWLQMELAGFVKALGPLSYEFQLPDDLGGVKIDEAEPVIELRIAGSTRTLQASLMAVYADDVRVPLASSHPSSIDFPVATEDPARWLVRSPDREQAAIARIMESGFQVLDASGSLFLRGEDEVIDFLTSVLPALRQRWQVRADEKLVQVESKLDRIVPRLEVEGGGTDWLACDVSWQVGGEALDRDTVRKLLQSGSRTLNLPRGGKAVISHHDAEVMEGFLLDTNPRQEDGRFYFPAQQEAYLRCLRAHYGEAEGEVGSGAEVKVPGLPDDLAGIVREYQGEGIQWLYRQAVRCGAALLADDMGLGKTLQALSFIQLWKKHGPEEARGPALVVCPATLLGNWRDEAAKFVPGLNVLVMHGPRRKDYYEVMSAADIIVTSYALIDKDSEYYQEISLGALVLDEASAIRNPDTLAAKAVRKVKAAARVAITGTPVENSVRDLWSIFQFMMPGYLGGREDFRLRYELPCAAEVPDRAAMQRLRWRTSPFMLRRTKSLVAKDLPPKIESVLWCDPSPLQKDQYQSILRHGAEKIDELRTQSGQGGQNSQGARMQMLTVLLRLRQSCCDLRLLNDQLEGKSLMEVSAKLARLMELLEEARRGDHRVLVFSQFTSMLSLIRDELDNEDVDYCYLDGSTVDRSGVVDRFQKPDGPPVFLISLKAGGYGLTLTAADTVVLFDPWWNPAVEAQAADRIHRIGQTKPSTIYKLITRGTVEEKILRLQERKRNVISAAMGEVGDEAGPMMSGLTEGEMLELLD